MKGPALKIVKTSAKFCCHLYSRGCEAERQLAVGGGSRHGAQHWAAAAAARRTAAAAAAASRSRRGCVRGGGRHHHPAQHPAPTPGCRLANFSGCSAGDTAGAAALQPAVCPRAAPRRPALASRSHCPAICENMCLPVWLFLVKSVVCTSCNSLHLAPWITYTVDGNPKEKLFIFSRVCKFFADIFARPAHHVPAGWSGHTEQVWPKLNR